MANLCIFHASGEVLSSAMYGPPTLTMIQELIGWRADCVNLDVCPHCGEPAQMFINQFTSMRSYINTWGKPVDPRMLIGAGINHKATAFALRNGIRLEPNQYVIGTALVVCGEDGIIPWNPTYYSVEDPEHRLLHGHDLRVKYAS